MLDLELCRQLEEWIVAFFAAYRAHGAVAGEYEGVVGKGKYLGPYVFKEEFRIAAREIGSPDTARKECITANDHFSDAPRTVYVHFAFKKKTESSGRVATKIDDLELDASQNNHISFFNVLGCLGVGDGCAELSCAGASSTKGGGLPTVGENRGTGGLLKFSIAAHMVPMGVGVDDVL